MALGRIIRDKSFVSINGETLYDVQSISASASTNNSIINVAGHGAVTFIQDGVLSSDISIERLAINEDPFTGIFSQPFSGALSYIDTQDSDRYFAINSGYLSNYNFSAQVREVPRISADITAYGNMIGGSGVPTGNFTTGLNDFLDNYIFPRSVNLTFSEGETNRVQSFDFSISIEREVRNRLGQIYSIPETFVSYPITAQLSIQIDVDEYSAPKIDQMVCAGTENISLQLTDCNQSGIRTFSLESGTLQSFSINAASDGSSNTATLNYAKNINNINEVENLFKELP